jgi:hypothetical protein
MLVIHATFISAGKLAGHEGRSNKKHRASGTSLLFRLPHCTIQFRAREEAIDMKIFLLPLRIDLSSCEWYWS